MAVGIADRFHLTGYTSGFPARYVIAIWMGSWVSSTLTYKHESVYLRFQYLQGKQEILQGIYFARS